MIKEEKGSATVIEYALVFPIVLLLVIALLFMALYSMQAALVNTYAQKAAVYVSRMVTIPDYYEFGDFTNKYDFPKHDSNWPSSAVVESVMDTTSPYRYLNFSGIISDTNLKNYGEDKLIEVLENLSIISGEFDCEIDVKNYFITQSIEVRVTETMKVPGVLKYFSINDMTLKASAAATATNPSEFVRDIDLVYMLVDKLMAQFNIDLDGFIGKLGTYKKKFGMG